MLVFPPAGICGRIGAVLSALIVVLSLTGLTMHVDFYAGKRRSGYFFFYTNLSNLVVLIYFGLLSPYLHADTRLHSLRAHADFAVMMCIMLTFSVFHTLIFPAVKIAAAGIRRTRAFRIAFADNLIEHYIVPWLVFVYWLLCSAGKAMLGPADALLWLALPCGYLAAVFLRARSGTIIREAGSVYPYPFLDVKTLGLRPVLRLCGLLFFMSVAAGLTVISAMHALFCLLSPYSLPGGGNSLILI